MGQQARSEGGRGRFLTLEGLDGAGKSTHVDWIADHLRQAGLDVLCTREPGGTPLGEALRELLLREPMGLRTETLLMFAARSEHLQALILPALAQGRWVLCDRFTDASFAYQGGGRGLGEAAVATLADWVHPGFAPDCTLLFDVPLAVAQARRGAGRGQADRFEQEDAAFFERTRRAYHARAAAEPARFAVIDASQDIAAVRRDVAARLQPLLATAAGAQAS